MLIKRKTVPMIRGIFTLLFCLSAGYVLGQVSGDYRSAVVTGNWNVAGSWERFDGVSWVPAGVPPSGVASAQTITILNGHTITVTANVIADQVVVNTGGTLAINAIPASAGLTINKSAGLQDLWVNGTVNIIAGSLRVGTGTGPIVRVSAGGQVNCGGSVVNSVSARILFESGSVFDYSNTLGALPRADWSAGSLCRITGDYGGVDLGLTGHSFANFEWNTPTLGFDVDLAGSLTTVNGDLNFVNTGGSIVTFNYSNVYSLNVGGNATFGSAAQVIFTGDVGSTVTIAGNLTTQASLFRGSDDVGSVAINVGGNTLLSGGTLDAGDDSGTTTLNLSGNYTNSGTTLTKSGSPSVGMTINFNGSSGQLFTSTFVPSFPVNYSTSGIANLSIASTSFLAGTGNLTVGAGTALTLLNVQNTGALRNGITSGAVRVSGSRTYNGSIVYGGSARQYMSAEHPGTAATRINNAAGVDLVGDVTFTTGVLDLDNGLLRIVSSKTLTVADVLHNGGFFGINSTSSLVINGSGAYGNLALTHISGTSMKNLTINRASGSVNQTTATLVIAGALTLQDGVFALGNSTTTINGAFAVGSGSVSGISTSRLVVGGTGTMPAGLSITGNLSVLTMNRASGTLNLTNTSPNFVNVASLNLSAGSINTAGGLRMAAGGNITRTNGFLLAAIGAVSIYNVNYTTFAASDITTGFEIPTSGTALNNFIINNSVSGTHTLHLDRVLNARGVITITRGRLATEGQNINVGRDFTVGPSGFLLPGTSTLTFDGSVTQKYTSANVYTINNLVINKSGGQFNLISRVDIATSFAINSNTVANVGTNRLTLLSTNLLTAYVPALSATASISGSVIVQRHLPNSNSTRAYRYVASPTTNSRVADWQAEIPITGTFSDPSSGTFDGVKLKPANPSLFFYNEALVTGASAQGIGYVNYPSSGLAASNAIINGRGYSLYGRTHSEITFDSRGTLRQQNVNVTVTHSGGTNGGYNLVGNPYPAPIDWDLTHAAILSVGGGIDNAIYFTDNNHNISASGNVAYVAGVSTPPGYSGNIASSQGFWVKVTSPGTRTIPFKENQKAPLQTQFIREGEVPNLLRVMMKSGNVADHIAIRLVDEATDAFDSQFDAYKFGAEGMLNLSTLSDQNDHLAINSVGRASCETKVQFYLDNAKKGSYTFDFTGIESFESGRTAVLHDKVLDSFTPIEANTHYAFSVSDVATAKDRFELVLNGPPLNTDMELTGESVCADNSIAHVTLQSSQSGVKYVAMTGDKIVSDPVEGTGGLVEIPVRVELLPQSENEISISAQMGSCDALKLSKLTSILIVPKNEISDIKDGTTCENGTASLEASGSDSNLYNWYESADDEVAIADQHGNLFTTPNLSKSKTYYVAAVNAIGCEGSRVEVKANVRTIEPVSISVEGNILTSSYAQGNQWYLDGVAVEDATSNALEAVMSGVYTVVATSGECSTTSNGREMVIMGTTEYNAASINVYPNPTADKVTIEIRSTNVNAEAKVVNTLGVELTTQKLSGTSDVKTGEFNLSSYPAGIYMIRVRDGGKLYSKRVSKK